MTLEVISNGLGSQSMYLLLMAAKGEIPARISITGDTGSENDRELSTGERISNRQYFDEIVTPFCSRHGIDARFVRSRDANGNDLPPLIDHLRQVISEGKIKSAKIPMFGSRGGRLLQVCTDKWKIRAINQEARRMGAKLLISAQGIHHGEAARRVKGKFLFDREDGYCIYQNMVKRNGLLVPVKWCQHYYPLVDKKLKREDCVRGLRNEGIPYLTSSECDMCPHQDIARWRRHSPEMLTQIAAIEERMGGNFFFTDERIPLMAALDRKDAKLLAKNEAAEETDFGCGNSYCGV